MKSLLELENKQRFFPFQPEITYIMDNYIEYKPLHTSSRNIALYYQFDAPKNAIDSFSLLPDGCFDMVFCCCKENHTAYLWTSSTQRSEEFKLQHKCKYFGVKFLPEQHVIKLNSSMRELLGKQIPLIDVVSIVPNAIEEITAAPTFYERINVFEKLLDKYTKKSKNQRIIEYCINKIYSLKGKLSINQLVADTGFSDRYIRNIFEEYVGFSPKQFSEVVRFQKSLSMMLKENEYSMLEIVHENGYHDQAHFIKRFKKHAHVSPSKYKRFLLE